MSEGVAGSGSARSWRREAAVIALLVAIGLAVSAPSLGNRFAYDDVLIVETNSRVHTLAPPWIYAQQDYWPTGSDRLYRPLTIWLYAMEWRAGGGSPLPFHLVNLALYLATIAGLYFFARRALPRWAAALAAAVFAVHPVHVEAVANVVGQAELTVGFVAIVAAYLYLKWRTAGDLGLGQRLIMALLLVVGALAKEQGAMLPFLLLAIELTVVDDTRPWRERARSGRPVAVMLTAAVVLVVALRLWALGSLSGGMQAVAIRDTTLWHRTLTMLSVVPEWLRLLVWPSHLQADYSPLEIVPATAFGVGQLLGLAVIGLWLWAVVRSWSRNRPIALGLLWLGIALIPVSNVLLPTGVVLAERTLYLPSMGLAIAAAAAALWLWHGFSNYAGLRLALIAAVAGLLGLAGWHSAKRQTVWRDNDTMLAATVQDAPLSYRALWQYAKHLAGRGNHGPALAAYAQAADLYGDDPRLLEDYGQLLRQVDRCDDAVPILEGALALDETRVMARSRLYYCMLAVGQTAGARQVAARGLALGDSAFAPLVHRADSLLAPRDTVLR